MVELIDNLFQCIVTLACCVGAGMLFSKSRKLPYLLLAGFYGLFALGAIYWTLHYALLQETPPIFYIADIAWAASYVCLLTMQQTRSTEAEKCFWHPAMLAAPVVCLPLMLFYMSHGDILFNLLYCGLTTAIACVAIRGLAYAKRQGDKSPGPCMFHFAALAFVLMEYCLWTVSCFWAHDFFRALYFATDFLVTIALLGLLPAAKKAVGK